MSNQLICSFNSYSFNHTAQTLITYLNDQEIEQLITAITNQPQPQPRHFDYRYGIVNRWMNWWIDIWFLYDR